ncbi:hypothetical protein [Phenylobacterium sp.]|uniref:hypothetical protein n=1 Tax=Phenylobacterium sp. TaxID=1871053 RepID=UPI00286C64CF|nr:hypothetical protein [Phenylobacterium sp.]
MTDLDIFAAGAATIAGGCLALRGYMLKPSFSTWASAPNAVATGLLILGMALGCAVVSIAGGAHANAREAAVYGVLAVVSAIMAWNVHRQRQAAAETAADERD